MATNFPGALDTLANPSTTDPLASPGHAGQHTDANDAIEALEAKVGVDGSAVTSSLDFRVGALETNGLSNPLAHDLVVTGDGASDISPDAPSVTLGVEVGGNNNAHIEIASPAATGTAYIDLTEVGSDSKARIQWTAADTTLKFQSAGLISEVAASVVSGSITAAGGESLTRPGKFYDTYHVSGGRILLEAGDITVAGDTPVLSSYLYFYGGHGAFNAGNITISGAVNSQDVLRGGPFAVEGGSVAWDSGDPYDVSGGTSIFRGGAVDPPGSGVNEGGALGGNGASLTSGGNAQVVAGAGGHGDSNGGHVILKPGAKAGSGTAGSVKVQNTSNTNVIQTDDTGIGFYNTPPVAQQTGVAVSDAAIHAALVNLGLITA